MKTRREVLTMNGVTTIKNNLVNHDLTSLFNEFIAYLDISKKSVESYKINLRQFFKYLQDNNLSNPQRQDILDYKNSLINRELKPTTIQAYLVSVKAFFSFLELKGYYPNISRNIKGIKVSKSHKKDYLLKNQVKALLTSIDTSTLKGARDYAIISLMVTSGLRTIEVIRADITDLRTIGNNQVLFIQGKGKNEKDNFVKLAEPVYKALVKYLTLSKHKGALFVSTSNNSKGNRLSTWTIRQTISSYFKEQGIKTDRLTAHSLRHTTATLNLLNGGTLEETKDLLRHESINTTLIYSHHLDRMSNQSEERLASLLF